MRSKEKKIYNTRFEKYPQLTANINDVAKFNTYVV